MLKGRGAGIKEKNKERNLDNISFLMKCFGRETERGGKREKEKIDRQPGHMTTDVECQNFRKEERGSGREREKSRNWCNFLQKSTRRNLETNKL
jgi:hypothetical protein